MPDRVDAADDDDDLRGEADPDPEPEPDPTPTPAERRVVEAGFQAGLDEAAPAGRRRDSNDATPVLELISTLALAFEFEFESDFPSDNWTPRIAEPKITS